MGRPRIAVAFPHTRFAHKHLCPGVLAEGPIPHCPPASTEEGEDRTGSPAHSACSRTRRASSHDSLCDAHGAPVRTPHLGSAWALSQPPSPSLLCRTHPFLCSVTTELLISFLFSKLGRSSSVYSLLLSGAPSPCTSPASGPLITWAQRHLTFYILLSLWFWEEGVLSCTA